MGDSVSGSGVVEAVRPEDRGLKDSGTRAQFANGAVRDTSAGKGRYDLLAVDAVEMLISAIANDPLNPNIDLADMWEAGRVNLALAMKTGDMAFAKAAMRELAGFIQIQYWRENGGMPDSPMFDLRVFAPYHAIFRVARVYEKGAQKYAARNWEKGINLSRMLDSAQRHWYQVLEGKTDEDHAGQALWNIMGWVQTRIWIDNGILPATFDDMPVYKKIEVKA